MTLATYQIRKDVTNKTIHISVGDKMTKEIAEKFVREYDMTVRSVNAAEYTLDIDCTNMKVLTPELADELEASFNVYKASGINKIIFQIQNDIVLKMQVSRLARKVGLMNTEFK